MSILPDSPTRRYLRSFLIRGDPGSSSPRICITRFEATSAEPPHGPQPSHRYGAGGDGNLRWKVRVETRDGTEWADLLLRVRDGQDRAAFAALFRHFAPRVKGFLMKSGAGATLAEECAQEIMAVLWHKAHLFIPAGKAMPDHGHGGTEMTMVLKGAFLDDGLRFGPGDVQMADATLEHAPVAEDWADCVCLAATDAKLRFKSLIPRLAQPFFRI